MDEEEDTDVGVTVQILVTPDRAQKQVSVFMLTPQ